MAPLLGKVLHFIVTVISSSGYPGIVILMAIESACIPLPSEIIMPFSGYLVSTGRFSLLNVTLSGAFGNLLGSILIYVLGGRGAYEFLKRISPRHVEKAECFYKKYGLFSVFLGRMLPIIRTFISLPSGIMRVPFFAFCLWTWVGSLPWCFALAYLGKILGEHWAVILPYFHRIDIPIILLLAGGIAYWLWRNSKS